MTRTRATALLLLLLAVLPALLAGQRPAAAQDAPPSDLPQGVVARVYGRDVTEGDLLDRLARTYERTDRGRESLDELVDDICVAHEAARRGAKVSQAELEEYLKRWDATIRQQSGGRGKLEDLYAETATREEFEATAREFLLRQKMAREDLGSKPDEELSEHYLKLWLSSLRRRAGVRYEDLPADTVAQVGEQRVTRRELARRIRSKLPAEMVAAVGNELVIAAAAEHDAREAGITVTDADLDEALADLRARFAEEPDVKGSGVTFDQFLKQSRGYGEADLRADPVFRSRIALRRMMEREVDDAAIRAHWEKNRDAYGERALVRQIFLQAGEGEGEFALPTFKKAWEDALGAKIEVLEAAGLHLPEAERPKTPLGPLITRVAKRLAANDEARRRAGEPVAWTRLTVHGEDALEKAVFEGPVGELQGPIKSSVGYHVLVVEERRPAPPYEQVEDRIRDDLVQEAVNAYQIRLKGDSEHVQRAF